jgi:hypothetical protein
VPSFRVLPEIGNRSAPWVMAALASGVHHRQATTSDKHDSRRQNNQ